MATWTWIGDQREVKMMRTVSGSVCSHSYKRHESGCGDLFDGSKVSGALICFGIWIANGIWTCLRSESRNEKTWT